MRTPILLYLVALAVRGVLVGVFPDPAYPDSSYYVLVARSIAGGHGLSVDVIWIFAEVGNRIPSSPTLPIPSNAHWLPLASLVQVPFILLMGPTALASALPLAVIGSLVAPLTWLIARDAGARPEVAAGAGLLAAIPAAGTVFTAQPENLAILPPLVAATLWLVARGLRGEGRAFAGAGLLAGVAALARNDGVFLAGAVGLIWVVDRLRWLRRRRRARAWTIGSVRSPIAVWAGLAAGLLFLLAVGPWWARQLAVFGSISPTGTSGAALWIRSIDEWNSLTAQPSLDRFLAQGLGPIVASRLAGLGSALLIFGAIGFSLALVPLLLVGMAARWRSTAFVPWFVYAPIVFLSAALIYPAHVPGGAFLHSAVGLFPHAYILVMEGVALLAGGLSGRLAGHSAAGPSATLGGAGRTGVLGPLDRGSRLALRLAAGLIVAFLAATAVVFGAPVIARWDSVRQPRIALAAELDRLGVPADDRLLSLDAAGTRYWTGRPGVVTPNDPIETIEAVARAYQIRWLVLERGASERDGPVAALAPVLDGGPRPAWIGPRAWSVAAADGGAPALALYPVCTSAGDSRCRP